LIKGQLYGPEGSVEKRSKPMSPKTAAKKYNLTGMGRSKEIYDKIYKSISVELRAASISSLGLLAKESGKSFSEYVEEVLEDHIEKMKANPEPSVFESED
jgi:hypothetical protein